MPSSVFRRCDVARRGRRLAVRPWLEGLEDRLLLYSANGGAWSLPARVTYSFVPDGTSIGGTPSNLFSAMNARFSPAAWEQAIADAAAVWEAVANINLVQVSDDGAPIGTAGNQQGDPRFGDIRIGGFAQSMNQLGLAFLPPPVNGGTNSGDIFYNTSQSWQINGSAYDLESVALHELGHALGLGHSANSSADMYANYSGGHNSATSDDIAGIQALYGARKPDAFASASSNSSSSTATNLNGYISSAGQVAIGNLDVIGTASEWFKVTVPSSTNGSMTVTLQSSGLSSLKPRLQVYNASMQGLFQASNTQSYGATVSGTVSGVSAGQVLYIKAFSATSTASAGGSYGLELNFGPGTQGPFTPPNTAVASQADRGGGSQAQNTGGGNFLGNLLGSLLADPLGTLLTTIGTLTGYAEVMSIKEVPTHQHGNPDHDSSAHPGRPSGPHDVDALWVPITTDLATSSHQGTGHGRHHDHDRD
jgi:predicted Zn-dependent protease